MLALQARYVAASVVTDRHTDKLTTVTLWRMRRGLITFSLCALICFINLCCHFYVSPGPV